MPSAPDTDRQAARAHVAARGIVRSFGERRVLDGVDLVRERAGIVGLVGANGAGKTTLLRIIAQLTRAEGGTLEIAGQLVERGDEPLARRLTGWAPHTPLAWLDETVEQNLRYAGRLAGERRSPAADLAVHAIEQWGLESVRAQPVRRLSRGWQQRYAIARADLLEPPVLLLDEPTTGLDTDARAHLEQALDGWRSTRVVVVSSHEHAWLEQRSDDIVELTSR